MKCLFCKMVDNEIECRRVYEDAKVLAFYDINPQAAVHFLVIPKKHIKSCNEITEDNCEIIGYIFTIIKKLAYDLGLDDGYRITCNCGKNGGQSVNHLHFHVMGGCKLKGI